LQASQEVPESPNQEQRFLCSWFGFFHLDPWQGMKKSAEIELNIKQQGGSQRRENTAVPEGEICFEKKWVSKL
jgi:hypothetical protein